MARANIPMLEVEDARIMFRNFRGEPKKFNKEGDRNFCLVIEDPERANQLAADGWNVRILAPRDPQDDPVHYIPVAVRFDKRPPKVYMYTKHKRTRLDEDSIGSLDYADIRTMDVIINPSAWTNDMGGSGIKAYLDTMHVTIVEDAFADKYSSYDEDDEEALPFN